LLKISRQI